MTYRELLHWIGLWIIMSTCDGFDHHSFWSSKNPDIFEGRHFRLQQFMSRYRFEGILSAIKYTNNNPPADKDRFWEVHQLLESWNNNMATNFIPLWINAIDESMSKWINEYTCPGFMFVPRNPGHLEMNIMMPDAVSLTSCGRFIYEKEKTDHHKLETRNTTIWVRQQEL